jgi:hypothetical protein
VHRTASSRPKIGVFYGSKKRPNGNCGRIILCFASKITKASHEAQEHFANSERCLKAEVFLEFICVASHIKNRPLDIWAAIIGCSGLWIRLFISRQHLIFPASKSTKASHEAQEHFANSDIFLNWRSVLGMLDVLIDSCMNSHEPELIRNKYDSILTTPIRRRLWNAISAPPQE